MKTWFIGCIFFSFLTLQGSDTSVELTKNGDTASGNIANVGVTVFGDVVQQNCQPRPSTSRPNTTILSRSGSLRQQQAELADQQERICEVAMIQRLVELLKRNPSVRLVGNSKPDGYESDEDLPKGIRRKQADSLVRVHCHVEDKPVSLRLLTQDSRLLVSFKGVDTVRSSNQFEVELGSDGTCLHQANKFNTWLYDHAQKLTSDDPFSPTGTKMTRLMSMDGDWTERVAQKEGKKSCWLPCCKKDTSTD